MKGQYLETIQYLDEQGRCMRVEFYHNDRVEGQINSHGYSYLKARKIIEDLEGEPIGLEAEVQKNGKIFR